MSEELPGVDSADTAETTGAKSNRRLTDAQYTEIRDLYELGTHGLVDLADKFGVSRQAIHKRFQADGVVRGSRAHELTEALSKGATSAAASAGAAAATKVIDRYADKREAWIEETRVQGYNALRQADLLAKKTIADALKAVPAKSLATVDDDLKAVQRFQRILSQNIASRLELLNAKDFIEEENLPMLGVEDLTEEDLIRHHKNIAGGDLDEDQIDEILDHVANIDLGAL